MVSAKLECKKIFAEVSGLIRSVRLINMVQFNNFDLAMAGTLFLVQFNNFAQTTGFYCSYTFLL